MEKLRSLLRQIDRKGYKFYKDIKGCYDFGYYTLIVDHVQGDPFAAPSRVRVQVPAARAACPDELWHSDIRKTACEDFLGRAVAKAITRHVKGHRGSGKSGMVGIETGGQQVLLRNAVIVSNVGIEARLVVGLPAAGRTVAARDAEAIFFQELPRVVEQGLFFENLPQGAAAVHVAAVEDQAFLRGWLDGNKLVAFVADGSVLPRRSGVDDQPMQEGALAFRSPDTLAYEPELPNAGRIRGMGIPAGVTLIVGGGFHGKSTLLHALERGVYNHIPGDGRERVATQASAVKVRAEDGRAISKVNISPFIDRLPFGRDTLRFTTDNGSGSTSQAANIIEALDCGARLLLIDEDTSATNFMIRDERMQQLVARDREPITPFLHRVRELYETHGVSSVIVMGGSGDYFDVSDTVIMMDAYEPLDVTPQAQALASEGVRLPDTEALPRLQRDIRRSPSGEVLDAARGSRDVKIDVKRIDTLLYGNHEVDLAKVEQLVDIGQTRAIGWFIHYFATRYAGRDVDLIQGLLRVFGDVERQGLDIITPYIVGNLALPRLHEVAAAINRIRGGRWS